MVAESGFMSRFPPVILRSTKPYGGIRHRAHDGACASDGCRIDRLGWIRDQVVREIPLKQFTSARRSCREPDEDLIEEVMRRMRRRRRRGVSGRSGR